MIKTKHLLSTEARRKLLAGVEAISSLVSITLGAKARSVAIAKFTPQGIIFDRSVVDDGVKVAKSIQLEDEFEQMGVQIIREAAEKQVDEVGDGTSVTILLASELVRQAYKRIAEGVIATDITRQLSDGLEKLLKELEKHKIPHKGYEDTVRIATVSCKDEHLGKLIADVFEDMGKDGVITVEQSKSQETVVEYQKGMQFDRGYVSHFLVTDGDNMTSTVEKCPILVTDRSIMNFTEMMPFLDELLKKGGRQLAIIAPDFGGDALPSFVQNKLENKFMTLMVKAPAYGEQQKAMLSDIALLTGANYITEEAGKKLNEVTIDDLGEVEHMKSTKDKTVISGGKGTKADIEVQIGQLKRMLEREDNDVKQEQLKERIAKLTNGVAVIKVGGQTEVEMQNRKDAVDDAVCATRVALEEGVVVGGETVFLNIRNVVKDIPILYDALKKPFYTILENAGLDVAEYYSDIMKSPKHEGVDVTDGKIKNLVKAGIIDPYAVARQSLKNAVSVANKLIITEGIVVPKEAEKK